MSIRKDEDGPTRGRQRRTMPETHIYKETDGCSIRLDVHRPEAVENGPAILWIHGGALIGGSRDKRDGEFGGYTQAGYTVFSIDYRLAPETKLPAIIEDVQDALVWVREQGPGIAGIDADRVATIGHSAGGYLTLMTGTFEQPPSALVSFYGYGDIVGPWYSEPDPFYCTKPMVDETEAREHHSGPPVTRPDERPGGGNFYLYCRQHGIWPNEVGGRDPKVDPAFFAPYSPQENVTESYPPTLLLHGTNDTDVPYDLSVQMANALSEGDIESRLITIEGGGHGFERSTNPQIASATATAREDVIAFLATHV